MEEYETMKEGLDSIDSLDAYNTQPVTGSLADVSAPKIAAVYKSEQAVMARKSGYVFDVIMQTHKPEHDDDLDHPEKPERILYIHDMLLDQKILSRMERLPCRPATKLEVCRVHTEHHWNAVRAIEKFTPEERDIGQKAYSLKSLYISPHTTQAAEMSCGGAVEAALAVAQGRVQTSFAIIRPPGHHAEPDSAMGFCFFNNIAVAARAVLEQTSVKKILILDWDVHHGNGTQEAFLEDPDVLFISIHRHDGGEYYPGGPAGGIKMCGENAGLGKNVNIPWPDKDATDADYLYAFTRIVLPIAYEFSPDLVMVSAGFDAAEGDPLGECHVTPDGYAHMTYLLTSLAGGKVVVLLEGGYELDVIPECALAVCKVLLGDNPPHAQSMIASAMATETIYQVALQQSKYWKSIHPPSVEPSEEAKDDIMTIPELLKAHRQHYMFEKHDMLVFPLAIDILQEAFKGQVIVSSDIYKKKTIVVFAHDFGNLYAELRGETTADLQLEHSYIKDASKRVVEMCSAHDWGLVDINTFPAPIYPDSAAEFDHGQLLKDVVTYVWDNCLELGDADSIVLISHGAGLDAIKALINSRPVRKLVKAVVQVLSMHDSLMAHPKLSDAELRAWFGEVSFLVVPAAHPAIPTHLARVRKRYRMDAQISDTRVTQLFSKAMPSIKEFIEASLTRSSEMDTS